MLSNDTITNFLASILTVTDNTTTTSIYDLTDSIDGLPIIPLLVLPDTNFAMYIEVTMMIIVIL